MALTASPYGDHESLLDPDPDIEHKLADLEREVDAALAAYDPHGRRNGIRGAVRSPTTADNDPLSPISDPVVVDLTDGVLPDDGSVDPAPVAASATPPSPVAAAVTLVVVDIGDAEMKPAESEGDTRAEPAREPEPEEAETPKPAKKAKKKKKTSRKRHAEEAAPTRPNAAASEDEDAAPPPKKLARKSKKREKRERIEQRRAARVAEAIVAAAVEEEEEEEDDSDNEMVDQEAEVDEEMELTVVIRAFVNRIYNLPQWRTDAELGSGDWMALAYVEREFRNDAQMSLALAKSEYRNIKELLLGSCGQTLTKMVVTARKKSHTARAKGAPEAEEIDGLAAKFIENSWHFRIYADIIQQYKDEGFVAEDDRSLGEVPQEDYEEDSFCVDDDDLAESPTDSDPDGEYAEAARAHKKEKKRRAAKPKKKKKRRVKRTASGEEDEAKDRALARRLQQAMADDLDSLLDADDAPSESAAAAVAAHEKVAKGKSKKAAPKGGLSDSGAWDAGAIDRVVASPETEWASRGAVLARAHDVFVPVGRLGAEMPEAEFDKMLGAFLKIARRILTPFAAAASEASQIMSISKDVGAEMKASVGVVNQAINSEVMRALKPIKKHLFRIIEFYVCTAVFVEKTAVREDADLAPGARCIWTDAPIAPGQGVYRVRAFTAKPDAHVARVMYVSEAPGDNPERYIDLLCTLRAHRHWHYVFMRKLFDWQSRECFSPAVTADMRMQRFLDSSDGLQLAATTLAEFFAHKHVIASCMGKK